MTGKKACPSGLDSFRLRNYQSPTLMDEELKSLMKNLGQVINEALTESPKINLAIQDIRDAGYEVFLIIEASIGFSRKAGDGLTPSDEEPFEAREKVRLQITRDDVKFLKSLKIAVDNESN
jgi:hypothetical protein